MPATPSRTTSSIPRGNVADENTRVDLMYQPAQRPLAHMNPNQPHASPATRRVPRAAPPIRVPHGADTLLPAQHANIQHSVAHGQGVSQVTAIHTPVEQDPRALPVSPSAPQQQVQQVQAVQQAQAVQQHRNQQDENNHQNRPDDHYHHNLSREQQYAPAVTPLGAGAVNTPAATLATVIAPPRAAASPAPPQVPAAVPQQAAPTSNNDPTVVVKVEPPSPAKVKVEPSPAIAKTESSPAKIKTESSPVKVKAEPSPVKVKTEPSSEPTRKRRRSDIKDEPRPRGGVCLTDATAALNINNDEKPAKRRKCPGDAAGVNTNGE